MKIIWHNGEVPEGLEIRQVYGLIFTRDGRMMMRIENKKDKRVYTLAGGTPEKFDADRVATLRRELIEEVNTEIEDEIYMVGYQEIDEENGRPPYAQVRMTALIKKIGQKQPDPDTGDTYDRFLTTPEKAIKLLNWGDVGKNQITRAAEIAKESLGINSFRDFDEEV